MLADELLAGLPRRTSNASRVRICEKVKKTPHRITIDGRSIVIAAEPLTGLLRLLKGREVAAHIEGSTLYIKYGRMRFELYDLAHIVSANKAECPPERTEAAYSDFIAE